MIVDSGTDCHRPQNSSRRGAQQLEAGVVAESLAGHRQIGAESVVPQMPVRPVAEIVGVPTEGGAMALAAGSHVTTADRVRELIADHKYLALGTADADGTPWVSPIFFSHQDCREFFWVSGPDTRHSRNIALRPQVSMAIYDSRVPIGQAEAVYLSARATKVPDDEIEEAAAIYHRRLPREKHFTLAELRDSGLYRLYRATALEHSVLVRGGATGADSRVTVDLG
ncbi:pyridoxamine 5'-phosphate oxidase family protein [Fodinicola feengrottensis]|uniref:pyridoxamine 5'-phosphate oxidase family protein n=1 Tax=Fodinicola feengrottensis TaxID=435914 RepID=UPI0031E09BEE